MSIDFFKRLYEDSENKKLVLFALLNEFPHLSFKTIAESLGIKESTVKLTFKEFNESENRLTNIESASNLLTNEKLKLQNTLGQEFKFVNGEVNDRIANSVVANKHIKPKDITSPIAYINESMGLVAEIDISVLKLIKSYVASIKPENINPMQVRILTDMMKSITPRTKMFLDLFEITQNSENNSTNVDFVKILNDEINNETDKT